MQSNSTSKRVNKVIQMCCLLENDESKSLIIHLKVNKGIILTWEIGHGENLKKAARGQDQDLP